MQPTIGRIIEFFPNGNDDNKLPNGMTSAPGIVTQVFDGTEHINITIFVADPNGNPIRMIWSVRNGTAVTAMGESYWQWPARP